MVRSESQLHGHQTAQIIDDAGVDSGFAYTGGRCIDPRAKNGGGSVSAILLAAH